jgi:hypothetical protein
MKNYNFCDGDRGEKGIHTFYYFRFIYSLNPAVYRCRIVIRNLETGQGTVAASTVVIPERPQAA